MVQNVPNSEAVAKAYVKKGDLDLIKTEVLETSESISQGQVLAILIDVKKQIWELLKIADKQDSHNSSDSKLKLAGLSSPYLVFLHKLAPSLNSELVTELQNRLEVLTDESPESFSEVSKEDKSSKVAKENPKGEKNIIVNGLIEMYKTTSDHLQDRIGFILSKVPNDIPNDELGYFLRDTNLFHLIKELYITRTKPSNDELLSRIVELKKHEVKTSDSKSFFRATELAENLLKRQDLNASHLVTLWNDFADLQDKKILPFMLRSDTAAKILFIEQIGNLSVRKELLASLDDHLSHEHMDRLVRAFSGLKIYPENSNDADLLYIIESKKRFIKKLSAIPNNSLNRLKLIFSQDLSSFENDQHISSIANNILDTPNINTDEYFMVFKRLYEFGKQDLLNDVLKLAAEGIISDATILRKEAIQWVLSSDHVGKEIGISAARKIMKRPSLCDQPMCNLILQRFPELRSKIEELLKKSSDIDTQKPLENTAERAIYDFKKMIEPYTSK